MGRPLSKQQFFNANVKNNIKVQFNNGTASVKGYIVEQTGSKRFVCKDIDGNIATCYLKSKASADLQPGEMSITVKNDAGSVYQVTKITRHRVSYAGISMPWSFDPSTTDGYVQIEEAGTDVILTDATDLEGDDAPPFDPALDYPAPGPTSGAWKTASAALNGVAFSVFGSPAEPGSSKTIAEAQYFGAGLRRDKYDGNFCAGSSTPIVNWDFSWFDNNSSNFIKEIIDTTPGWGQQTDGSGVGEHHFSVQWTGYFKVPTTQDYNIYGESDDHIGVWVGSSAVSGFDSTNILFGSSNKSLPSGAGLNGQTHGNTLTLDANKWYPIRIWFSEFSGGCKAQLYFIGADGSKNGTENIQWAFNPQGLY